MKKKISKVLEKITTGLMHAFAASVIVLFSLMPLDCFFGALNNLSDSQIQTLGFTLIGTVLGSLFGTLTIGAAANALDNSIHRETVEKRGKELADSLSSEQLMLKYEDCVQRRENIAQRLDNLPMLSIIASKGKKNEAIFCDSATFQNYDCHDMAAIEEQLSAIQNPFSQNILAVPVMALRRNGAYEAIMDSTAHEYRETLEEIEYLEYALATKALCPAPRITVTTNNTTETLTEADNPESTGLLMRLQ